jgi:predicted Rossmann fold flavoprotein
VKNPAYDIAVIGGGPAGMMAAGTAAEQGASVILIEKNDKPGRKLLITGKGRCNITRDENDIPAFCDAFGKKGKFLYSALRAFGVEDTISFFNQRGLATKVERGQRVFPVSDSSQDVLGVLTDHLKEHKVKIMTNCSVTKLVKKGNKIEKIKTSKGDIQANQYVICTGGLTYPSTGSSGDGYKWAKLLGHSVTPPQPSLTPVKAQESWIKDLQGLSLKNVRINIYQNNPSTGSGRSKKQAERFGEALFTSDGLSGPIILDMSQKVGQLLKTGPVELRLDLKPALEYPKLDARLQRDFRQHRNKTFRNSLSDLLPSKLIPTMVHLSGINPDKVVNKVTKEERNRLLHLFKEMTFKVRSLYGFDKAIATAGGISLKEIDPRSMRSKMIKNLYFAGEMIDLDGPTGGYNLQMCWSTGYLAGFTAAGKL